ncbi:MAG: signal peptidase II [Anaerotruncus sp.]|nr:signal peptidase II [Anaerotruncus sp.]
MTIFIVALAAVLVGVDQWLKIWALEHLAGQASVPLVPHLLQLTYVENRGAAFGVFQGKVEILSILTGAVLVAILIALLLGKFRHNLLLISVGLILAGGFGNLIDRLFRGFVVDYLDISPLFSFPVFNFADCCVVIGTFLMLIYLLFLEGKVKEPTNE